MKLTAIILTKDEGLHIARAIKSARKVASEVIVVDSGSQDDTVQIAKGLGARILTHAWTNHAAQFNWALDQIKGQGGWVLRLDADEILSDGLVAQIKAGLPDAAGVTVGRRVWFQGEPVRYGGVFPVQVLRLFREGQGRCENRWMDEHITVQGQVMSFDGEIIDDNRNALDWWTAKHNAYASREVIDILNRDLNFLPQLASPPDAGTQMVGKRWIKDRLYARLPLGTRAGVYFFYRYILRGGWRDSASARQFHVLQGFWYRYLVDARLAEVRRHMAQTDAGPVAAIADVLHVDVTAAPLPPSKRVA